MEIEDLLFYNNHWQTGQWKPSSHPIKRKLFSSLLSAIDNRYIVTIQGLRRTGKSVLQSQFVDEFHKRNPPLPVTSILKFTFEKEDDLDLLPSQELQDLLKLYFQKILKTQPAELRAKVIIALDEIQNIDNWQSVVKKYYDINENIKFILTGSSSLYLKEGAESLAGRTLDFELPCLDFEEYLAFTEPSVRLRFAHSLDELQNSVPHDIDDDVVRLFEDYLFTGGFPETALMFKAKQDTRDIHRFIRESIINKVIKRDLKKYFHVKNTIADQRMFQVCCRESSGFMELAKLAPETGLSLMSVKKHLEIFEQSHLIHFLAKFDNKIRREIRSTRKIYVASPCLMFAFAPHATLENREFVGHVAETYAFCQLKKIEADMYVEKGKTDKDEVDFLFPLKNSLVECKYTQNFDSRKFKYLTKRIKDLKAQGFVLSKKSWGDARLDAFPLFLLAP